MPNSDFASRVAKFRQIQRREGVKAIANWKLPNTDIRFDNEAKAQEFAEDVDAHVDMIVAAVESIVPVGNGNP